MARKGKAKAPMLTLEQQLAQHETVKPLGRTSFATLLADELGIPDLAAPTAERRVWDRRRAELSDAIRKRDAKAVRDADRDASGNYAPSPYAAAGHKIETAPKDLGKELPKDSAFPKRIATQRVIDRYRARGHIDEREWKAADWLWRLWCDAGLELRQTSTYEPVTAGAVSDPSRLLCKRVAGASEFVAVMAAIPYRSQGCVRAVVVEDVPASEWARRRGYRHHDSEAHGLRRLRHGLQALAAFLHC